jgi:hypothetical protein
MAAVMGFHRLFAGGPDIFPHGHQIQAIGIAQSYCWESPKPLEFGSAGQNWENVGGKVKVAFTGLYGPRTILTFSGRYSLSGIRRCNRMGMACNRFTSPKFPGTLRWC